ncbi:MAG TPA: hypothetical protein VM491_18515 [Burkholderiaceae bacterium]|nr:hypothetical protein [Burkholderiaceae bacterium]
MQPLSEGELREMHARPRLITFVNPQNVTSQLETAPDGLIIASGPSGTTTGSYRIDGNRFCSSFPQRDAGREVCTRLYPTGTQEFQAFGAGGEYRGRSRYTD